MKLLETWMSPVWLMSWGQLNDGKRIHETTKNPGCTYISTYMYIHMYIYICMYTKESETGKTPVENQELRNP